MCSPPNSNPLNMDFLLFQTFLNPPINVIPKIHRDYFFLIQKNLKHSVHKYKYLYDIQYIYIYIFFFYMESGSKVCSLAAKNGTGKHIWQKRLTIFIVCMHTVHHCMLH